MLKPAERVSTTKRALLFVPFSIGLNTAPVPTTRRVERSGSVMKGQTSAGADAKEVGRVMTTEPITTKVAQAYTGPVFAPGQVVGRYQLVCRIGDGGMAHVWAARDQGARGGGRLVALKIIHSRFAENPTFRTMFLDEARIVS